MAISSSVLIPAASGVLGALVGAPILEMTKYNFSKLTARRESRKEKLKEWGIFISNVSRNFERLPDFRKQSSFISLSSFLDPAVSIQVKRLILPYQMLDFMGDGDYQDEYEKFQGVMQLLKNELIRLERKWYIY